MEYPKEVADLVAKLESSEARHMSGRMSVRKIVTFKKLIEVHYPKSPIRGIVDVCVYTDGWLTSRTVYVDCDTSVEWTCHPHRKSIPKRVLKMRAEAKDSEPHRSGTMTVVAEVSFEQTYQAAVGADIWRVTDTCSYDEHGGFLNRKVRADDPNAPGDCCDCDCDGDGVVDCCD